MADKLRLPNPPPSRILRESDVPGDATMTNVKLFITDNMPALIIGVLVGLCIGLILF